MQVVLTPDLLLQAYRQGLFPMAYDAHSPYVHWVRPEMRGQLSITDLHISRSLKKVIKRNLRDGNGLIKVDHDFEAVIKACAEPQDDRPETWINDQIIESYCDLYRKGHAHSVEYWQGDTLIGGLYGLSIGGAFFGESMFSRISNASKVALVHLIARLWKGGYKLLDTQFVNDHLQQFGVYELPHEKYMQRLAPILTLQGDFTLEGLSETELIDEYFQMRFELQ